MAERDTKRPASVHWSARSGRPPHERVAELYESSFADRYDISAAVWERQFGRHALRAFHGRLRLLPKRPLKVLDLGCGTGRNLKHLAAAGIEVDDYTGVDRSTRMLERARSKHPYSRARFMSSDAIDAAHSSGAYDLVLATWILSHQPNPGDLLDAARTALAPEGHLLVLALTATHEVKGRVHGWRFRRFLSADPIDPTLLHAASPSFLAVSAAGLISCVDIIGGQRPPTADVGEREGNGWGTESLP